MHSQYSAAIPSSVNAGIGNHLIRGDREEDVLFALWYPSYGKDRLSALIHTPIYPEEGDRQRHGNASFNPQYLERACKLALVHILAHHEHPFWNNVNTHSGLS